MNGWSLMADLEPAALVIGLVCLGPPLLGLAWLAWVAIRESMTVLAGRKRYGGRRKPRFGLGLLFVFTAALALAWGLIAAGGAGPGVLMIPCVLLGAVFLTALFYFVVFMVSDVLISFGWLTPRVDPRGRLLGSRRSSLPQDPFDQPVASDQIEIREPEGENVQGEEGKKKKRRKRHWWARAMPDRSRFIDPGKDHNVPLDRDEYSG